MVNNINRAEKFNKSNSSMNIPDYAIERIARSMLPMIQNYYDSEEGQQELAVWKEKTKTEQKK